MTEFIDMLRSHDIKTLKSDALSLEPRWPHLASQAYELLAEQVKEQSERQHFLRLAKHFSDEAQRKNTNGSASIAG